MQYVAIMVETQLSESRQVEVQSRLIAPRRPEETNPKKLCKVRMLRISTTMTLNYRHLLTLMLFAVCVTLISAEFRCPEDKGFFPDPEQCDLYYACVNGQPEERLCKDGLVFRDDNPKKDFCDLPANVPCGDRTLLRKFYHFNAFKPVFIYFFCIS